MADEKDLKKADATEKHAVAGGGVYFSKENGHYYIPNPDSSAKYKWKAVVPGPCVSQNSLIDAERAKGHSTVYRSFATTTEAKAAAAQEAQQILQRIAADEIFRSSDDERFVWTVSSD